MKELLVAAMLLVLVACISVSPEAREVPVHRKMSSLLDGCTRLGSVTASGSTFEGPTDSQYQLAEYALRQAAWDKYRADTVVVINYDQGVFDQSMQGIALKCEGLQ